MPDSTNVIGSNNIVGWIIAGLMAIATFGGGFFVNTMNSRMQSIEMKLDSALKDAKTDRQAMETRINIVKEGIEDKLLPILVGQKINAMKLEDMSDRLEKLSEKPSK